MNLRRAATTSLALVVALTLGMGSASAADHEKASRALVQLASQPVSPGTAAARRGCGFLTGYPHEVHTDERMIEEELDLGEAAPHTLWRFDAGSV